MSCAVPSENLYHLPDAVRNVFGTHALHPRLRAVVVPPCTRHKQQRQLSQIQVLSRLLIDLLEPTLRIIKCCYHTVHVLILQAYLCEAYSKSETYCQRKAASANDSVNHTNALLVKPHTHHSYVIGAQTELANAHGMLSEHLSART